MISFPFFWIGFIGLLAIVLKLYIKATSVRNLSISRLFRSTAIVTGATSGIGKEIAFGLAFRGAKVILACRNLEKGRKIRDEIIEESGNKNVEVQYLELTSLDSVRKFAQHVIANEPHVEILVNNAAATGLGNKCTVDGLQIGMQINHFAPFLLTCLLVGKMKKSEHARILMITSLLHHCAKFDIDNINCEKSFSESQVYFCSKLLNIIVANVLAKKLRGTGVTVNSVHPGLVYSPIWKHLPILLRPIFQLFLVLFFKDAQEASQTPIFVACHKQLDNVTGKFFAECELLTPSPKATNDELNKAVWEMSEALVHLKPEEKDF
ncbi:retinol dehydrogenase 11-like [Periplaneta americana]|uniref:retinol dehydrogenase 11-like n=1 Tax=Periplaneta americana TaxID=6978 RepID=UPI0037E9B927